MVTRQVHGFVRERDVLMWNAEDVVWLRREWRVVGSLVGALPLHPRQNSQLGLPLILQPEETTLLREKGVLELWEYTPPSLSERDYQLFQELRAQDVQEQWSTYQSQRGRVSRKRKSEEEEEEEEEEEVVGKREKLDTCLLETSEGRATEGGNAGPSKSRDISGRKVEGEEVGPSKPHGASGEQSHNKGSSFSPHVCIHTADPRTKCCPNCFRHAEWLFPSNKMEVPFSVVLQTSPSILQHQSLSVLAHNTESNQRCGTDGALACKTTPSALRYHVFSDLWTKGYHLTNGLKYGGDYLVYPGDPALVHAHYVAVVLPWQQPIPSLVSLGRLGSKVKKNVLLCSEDVHGDVQYFTLQWSGLP